ncbi:hypothetical protein N8T08_002925 [Aspergillus melleus]|uniref:Uncharacterized protein n=1 Tax=Aspergillus melleus TaxID=138277 RepID=A0ACC3B7G2_9EURO|nr:hypothetical protein N8T08_002925 [Aspergillus melleus]
MEGLEAVKSGPPFGGSKKGKKPPRGRCRGANQSLVPLGFVRPTTNDSSRNTANLQTGEIDRE